MLWKNWDAEQIERFVRALTHPYSGARSRLSTGEKVQIWRVSVDEIPICGVVGRIVVLKGLVHVVCANNSSVTLMNYECEIKNLNGMRFS